MDHAEVSSQLPGRSLQLAGMSTMIGRPSNAACIALRALARLLVKGCLV